MHLLGIPKGDGTGQEVIAKWRVLDDDFGNLSTFYTDSNGLEMQKRVLNYRETFDLKTNMTTSANYYPINSAIALVNEPAFMNQDLKQITVMNDRAQGGSSLENGSIELMQNRRLFFDDDRGVEECLDETEGNRRNAKGIAVNAIYRVQLVFRGTKSTQR